MIYFCVHFWKVLFSQKKGLTSKEEVWCMFSKSCKLFSTHVSKFRRPFHEKYSYHDGKLNKASLFLNIISLLNARVKKFLSRKLCSHRALTLRMDIMDSHCSIQILTLAKHQRWTMYMWIDPDWMLDQSQAWINSFDFFCPNIFDNLINLE